MTDATAFLYQSHRARYAAAAAFERDERARLYPQRVREKKLSPGAAEADWRAWHAIAAWCAGESVHADMKIATMAEAAGKAQTLAERAVQKDPADAETRGRRDALHAIATMLCKMNGFMEQINRDLRARTVAGATA